MYEKVTDRFIYGDAMCIIDLFQSTVEMLIYYRIHGFAQKNICDGLGSDF